MGWSHDVMQIREHLGVDTLGYLSLDGMLRAAGGDPADFCHACFSGDYPTDIPDDLAAAGRRPPPPPPPLWWPPGGAPAVGGFFSTLAGPPRRGPASELRGARRCARRH